MVERRVRSRRLPVGAEVLPEGGTHFRVWAPRRKRVTVEFDGAARASLTAEEGGYFSAVVPGISHGARYRYLLDDDPKGYPDPASRAQPDGPHGHSQVIDPSRFHWTDASWKGAKLAGQVLYEMHVGTFTPEGTWEAAARELAELRRAGVTVIEMMPVAEFPGRFGWGYDGVDLFAPTRLYGSPDDLRRFVNRAHAEGLGVIIDVVFNHLGPDGNYLPQFSEAYFSSKYKNEWGEAINYDGDQSGPVREFFIANAGYWIEEYHFDGLRIDATQCIYDSSSCHVMAEMTARVREAGRARGCETLVIAENEPQHAKLVRGEKQGGYGMDALWNDDFHHSARVALTGRSEAYLTDYRGTARELLAAVKWGYLFQGQRYRWQKQRRGTSALDLSPAAFVLFTQNHDQLANSGLGLRQHLLAAPGVHRAMTALLLLAPSTPMLFQGQEFAASAPFLYFADHHPELAALVAKGRGEFMAQFPSLATPEMQRRLPLPHDPATFARCKLDFKERESHAEAYALHRDLLRLRREDPCFASQEKHRFDGATLTDQCLLLRFFADDGMDRLLLVNLGPDLHCDPAPEPLLGPPDNAHWTVHWSSEDTKYGGIGTPDLDSDEENWRIPGRAAVVLAPTTASSNSTKRR